MMNSSRIGFISVSILCVFLCILLGAISAKHLFAALSSPPHVLNSVQLLPEPKPLPAVLLRSAKGEAFPREKFQGRWSLVFFGFTSCPDFCPMELQKLSSLLKLSQRSSNPKKNVQIVFVSVDPERDSAEKLVQYLAFFHPQIIGLRGDNPAIASFARFFGAAYDRSAIINNKAVIIPAGVAMPVSAGEQYLVNHATRVFVVDSQGKYVGSIVNTESPELIWEDLQKLF